MSVEISAPVRADSGVINPRANEAREQIFSPQVFDWVMRGYVYSVGLLVDDTSNIPSSTTLADTAPTVSLESPTGGDTIVVPLRVTCTVIDDPGGASSLDLVFTKKASDCATALTLSGTAMTGILNHLSGGSTCKSKLEYTVTASALTVVDSIVLSSWVFPDEGLTAATFYNPVFDYVFTTPIALTDGAALLIYTYAASTASEMRPCITWAEIPANIYKP